jgi:hypothetical protein
MRGIDELVRIRKESNMFNSGNWQNPKMKKGGKNMNSTQINLREKIPQEKSQKSSIIFP